MTGGRDDIDRDDDLLAAEYVLGVLDLAERGAFEARLKAEPRLATSVARWEARLTPLADKVRPVHPSADLLPRIEARLFPVPARKPWLNGIWTWAGTAIAAGVVAAFYFSASPKPVLQATLAANESQVSYLVQVSSDEISLTLSGPAPSEGQSHELWLIEGDNPPVSLGVIGAAPLPLDRPLAPGMILAVSLEPAGGSPTGSATGPVISLGPLEGI
jgi:anti-sigma-K factor RskA